MNYRDGYPILNLSGTENRPWGFRGQRRVAAARLVALDSQACAASVDAH